MYADQFDAACRRCGKCLEACPQYSEIGIIDSLIDHLRSGTEPGLDITRCFTCGMCEEVCPEGLSLKQLIKDARLKKVAAEGLSDLNFLCDPSFDRNIFKTAASL